MAKILVVDDDEMNRDMLSRRLLRRGYEVDLAVNGQEAIEKARRDLPALTVRGGVTVRRVLVERGRAVGVLTDDGPVRAGEVVLSAGAVGSAHLLLASGLGPAADLAAAGVPGVAE